MSWSCVWVRGGAAAADGQTAQHARQLQAAGVVAQRAQSLRAQVPQCVPLLSHSTLWGVGGGLQIENTGLRLPDPNALAAVQRLHHCTPGLESLKAIRLPAMQRMLCCQIAWCLWCGCDFGSLAGV